jgi:hypothetical protein
MKSPLLPRLVALLGLALGASAVAADAGFKPMFNGKDLSDWDGNPMFWSVRDGAITGQSTPEKQVKPNTFLVWKGGEPANFEMRGSFKLTAQNDKKPPFGNSGVQYRSKVLDPALWVVGGYQMDIDMTGRYTGMLYEEKGRGILMNPGEVIKIGETTTDPTNNRKKTAVEKLPGTTPKETVTAAYKIGEWNEFRIVAQGDHLQQFLNGVLTADVTDADETLAPKSGVIALQMHQGDPMTIQFKDLQLKTLP